MKTNGPRPVPGRSDVINTYRPHLLQTRAASTRAAPGGPGAVRFLNPVRQGLEDEAAAFWNGLAVGFLLDFLRAPPGPVILGKFLRNLLVYFRIAQQVHVVFQVF